MQRFSLNKNAELQITWKHVWNILMMVDAYSRGDEWLIYPIKKKKNKQTNNCWCSCQDKRMMFVKHWARKFIITYDVIDYRLHLIFYFFAELFNDTWCVLSFCSCRVSRACPYWPFYHPLSEFYLAQKMYSSLQISHGHVRFYKGTFCIIFKFLILLKKIN